MANPRKKYIGINRKIDPVGRITLPIEYREELGIECGEEVEIRLATIGNRKKVIEIRKVDKSNEN